MTKTPTGLTPDLVTVEGNTIHITLRILMGDGDRNDSNDSNDDDDNNNNNPVRELVRLVLYFRDGGELTSEIAAQCVAAMEAADAAMEAADDDDDDDFEPDPVVRLASLVSHFRNEDELTPEIKAECDAAILAVVR